MRFAVASIATVALFCTLLIGVGWLVLRRLLVSHVEVARLAAPDGAIDAAVIETNGGATTDFGYEIHVVPHGAPAWTGPEVADLYGAARNAQAYGVNVHWADRRTIVIEYATATSARSWSPVTLWGLTTVRATLAPGIVDPSAPAGGMEYNNRRR